MRAFSYCAAEIRARDVIIQANCASTQRKQNKQTTATEFSGVIYHHNLGMSSSAPVARLSCEQCQRRKVKCDKLSPCTACRSTGVACNTVQRARRPRGKSAKPKEGEIDARVARLEDLVKQLKVC